MRAVLCGHRGLIGHAALAPLKDRMEVLTAGRAQTDIALDLNNPANTKFPAFAADDIFIHAAGVTDEELVSDQRAAVLRATIAFDALLTALIKAGLQRIIYISSIHVLGPLEGEMSESSRVNPMSLYALMHYNGEQLIKRYVTPGKLKSATILRPCAVFGLLPDMKHFSRWSLIPYSFPKEVAEKQTITLLTPGLQERNFVSTETIARGIAEATADNHSGFRIIHPQGHFTGSVLAFAKRCADVYKSVTGKDCQVIAPKPEGKSPPVLSFHSTQGWREPESLLNDYLTSMITLLSKPAA